MASSARYCAAVSRPPGADHQLMDLVEPLLLALGRAVAVVALIDAVEFKQVVAVLVESRLAVRQAFGEAAAQRPAVLLEQLDLGNLPANRHRMSPVRNGKFHSICD